MSDRPDLGIIDLTKVAAPDIRVKLKRADDTEQIYRVPGNAPSGLMVEMMVLLREVDNADEDDLDLIASLREQIQEKVDDLFALRNAEYEDRDIVLNDDELATLMAGLFTRYYNSEEGPEGGDRPTEEEPEAAAPEAPESEAAPSPSTPSTPRRKRSGQRSRRSSPAAKSPSRSSTSSPT
jgi:hypothetical protein